MKVSITFDKNIKQGNKKHWVKQIQNVVDRLNNRSYVQNSPSKNPHKFQYKQQEDHHVETQIPQFERKQNLAQQRLIKQLMSIQRVMEYRFTSLTGTMEKLCYKINNMEKRLTVLEAKYKDFDRQFAQLTLKYSKIRRSSHNEDTSKKRSLVETADSVFSSYTRYHPDRANS